ncbi:FecR domain-containing protein [candidate division TA06 bacterium]|nr:FecR domain-containing protein [candidate division TA06 bacterium]
MSGINKNNAGLLWLLAAVLLVSLTVTTVQLTAKATPVAKVSFVVGDVKTQKPEKNDWKKVTFDQPLAAGEKVKSTEDARAEIAFSDGSIIRVDANTQLAIEELSKSPKKGLSASGKVWSGKVWANVNKVSKKSKFELESPTAVAAVRGTVYRMTVMPDSSTKVAVYQGEVKVEVNPDFFANQKKKQGGREGEIEGPQEIAGPREVKLEQWIQIVKAQMEITINADGTYGIVNFNPIIDSQDEWVKWNQERDMKLGRKQ